jgi:hypothetical protein
MERFLRVIRNRENRKALGWLGGGLLALGPAVWVVITYFFPADPSPPPSPERPGVHAEGGSLASGRDTRIGGDFRPGSPPESGAEGGTE